MNHKHPNPIQADHTTRFEHTWFFWLNTIRPLLGPCVTCLLLSAGLTSVFWLYARDRDLWLLKQENQTLNTHLRNTLDSRDRAERELARIRGLDTPSQTNNP